MSEEQKELEAADADDEEESSEEEGKKSGLKKKLMLAFYLVPVLLLLGGGYIAASHFGMFEEGAEEVEEVQPAAYYDLPEMVVNLSANDKRAQYLKLKVSLEAHEDKSLKALDPVMPRVLDMFQVYLRELRSSDLEGSAGIFRLKEELLRRINLAIHPNRIDRVLFKEIIVQ